MSGVVVYGVRVKVERFTRALVCVLNFESNLLIMYLIKPRKPNYVPVVKAFRVKS